MHKINWIPINLLIDEDNVGDNVYISIISNRNTFFEFVKSNIYRFYLQVGIKL
jgi:hypothetical protein